MPAFLITVPPESGQAISLLGFTEAGKTRLMIHGVPNATYTLERSVDLNSWTEVGVRRGEGDFVDESAAPHHFYFYRVKVTEASPVLGDPVLR